MIYGVQPGPLMIKEHPDVFWGLVTSMYVGNIMLLLLNLPLIGIWVRILKIPYKILFPLIIMFCLIGVYSVNNSMLDVFLMIIFGVVGYLMRKFDYEAAPLILAFILGPMLEDALRQSLIISNGSFAIFFNRPIAAGGIICSLLMMVSPLIPGFQKKRSLLKED